MRDLLPLIKQLGDYKTPRSLPLTIFIVSWDYIPFQLFFFLQMLDCFIIIILSFNYLYNIFFLSCLLIHLNNMTTFHLVDLTVIPTKFPKQL